MVHDEAGSHDNHNADYVWPVVRDGRRLGQVFGSHDRFQFLLDDRIAVDVPRGHYETAGEAALACEHMAMCLAMAEQWDDRLAMMLDT